MTQENNNQDKIQINIWKDFFKYLKPYKLEFGILALMMICLGILDSIFPLMTKYAIDNFIEKNTLAGIEKFGFVYFSAVIALALTVYLFISLAGKLETKMAYDIRKIGFEKLQLYLYPIMMIRLLDG